MTETAVIKQNKTFKDIVKMLFNDLFVFPFYILTHPVKGFEELKYEKKGKTYVAVVYVTILIISIILNQTSSGFLVNPFPNEEINIIKTTALVVVPLILVGIGNWSVTSLMDGKGKVTEILMTVCYSLIPFIWFSIPLTFIGNFLIQEEVVFFQAFITLSILLSGYMVFMGLLVIHEFGLLKTVLTIVFTLVAIAIIIFIGILILTLFQQVYNFIKSVYQEFLLKFR